MLNSTSLAERNDDLLTEVEAAPDVGGRKSTRQCETCGNAFESARADARFCSATCRQRAHRNAVTDNAVTAVTDNAKSVTDNPPQVDDSEDFNWQDARAAGNIVQERAHETAVYVNPFGQVVIRQACWPDDD